MGTRDITFVFDADSESASVQFAHLDPTCFQVPTMETGTTELRLQRSWDPPSVADSAATWVDLYDTNDAIKVLTCSDAGPRHIQVNPGDFMKLGRCRLAAVDSSGDAVAQVAQEVPVEVRSL